MSDPEVRSGPRPAPNGPGPRPSAHPARMALARNIIPEFAREIVSDLLPGDYALLGGLVVGVADVTPEAADLILTSYANPKNRYLIQSNFHRIMQAIKDGAFRLNGETIIFGKPAPLYDGHHRLRACVLADRPFRSVVVLGVEPEGITTLDAGASRTDPHRLTMDGFSHGDVLSGAIHILYTWCRSNAVYRTPMVPYHEKVGVWIPAHPKLPDSCAFAKQHQTSLRFYRSPAVAAFLHYVTMAADAEVARAFWEGLVRKQSPNRAGGTAVSVLLDRLMDPTRKEGARSPRHISGARRILDGEMRALYTFVAWNAFHRGDELSKLQLPKQGSTPRLSGMEYAQDERPLVYGWHWRQGLASETRA
jgi:hypothetical protein